MTTCPACTKDNDAVKDSRPTNGGKYIRRRRKCLSCGHKWSTIEIPLKEHAGRGGRDKAFRTTMENVTSLLAKMKEELGDSQLNKDQPE